MSSMIWLVVTLLLIVVFSAVWKIHPVPVLLGAGMFYGVMTGKTPEESLRGLADGFGGTMGKIGFIIIAGTVIGVFMEKRGAVPLLAEKMIRATGRKNVPLAMAGIGFVTSLTIFCDSAFVILSGLCRKVCRKAGFPIAVGAGALAVGLLSSHCMVPPMPGPTAAVGLLGADMGLSILFGLAAAASAAVVGWLFSLYNGRGVLTEAEIAEAEAVKAAQRGQAAEKTESAAITASPSGEAATIPASPSGETAKITALPSGETATMTASPNGESMKNAASEGGDSGAGESAGSPLREESESETVFHGSGFRAVLPILVPLLLILIASIYKFSPEAFQMAHPHGTRTILFLGLPAVALVLGAGLAIFALGPFRGEELSVKGEIGKAILQAANILIITSAGGAFGELLRQSTADGGWVEKFSGSSPLMILLPVLVAAFIKTAQGSSTVAEKHLLKLKWSNICHWSHLLLVFLLVADAQLLR